MILLVDNYDSFTYNLAQYLGQFAYVKVLRNDAAELYQMADEAHALVLSPGPGWPAAAGKMENVIKDFAGKKPILGICLGHQAIAESFGGRLGLAHQVMHGKQSQMVLTAPCPIFDGLPSRLDIMRYHSIVVEELPGDFEIVARTADDAEIMAIQHKTLPIYGLQYHPESIGTPQGLKMIENFVKIAETI
ncbi:aminodeoxychorismate/anthranilate synthase component II [Streptococcus devriesei]|uniref:aminodeoxychorismate/anthranilate synthase component II n=1 Tax=Streptococcus devriesei TaxID=231233 RepID=UPI00041414FC|nr:aminodeoxychorismate/anthranilate synthase component II [Streptococcus devriesei]